jgi:hypothetical protein
MRLLKKPPKDFETVESFAILVKTSDSTVRKRIQAGVLQRADNGFLDREESLRRWKAYTIAFPRTRGRGLKAIPKRTEIHFASPLAEKLTGVEIEEILDAAENAFSVAPISASEVWFSWRNLALRSRAGRTTIMDVFDLEGSLVARRLY